MNVSCPNCATVYRVDPAKVPAGGVRARCNVCAAVFAVRQESTADTTRPATPAQPQESKTRVPEAPQPTPPDPHRAPATAPAASSGIGRTASPAPVTQPPPATLRPAPVSS